MYIVGWTPPLEGIHFLGNKQGKPHLQFYFLTNGHDIIVMTQRI